MTTRSGSEEAVRDRADPGSRRIVGLILAAVLGLTVLGLRAEGRRWWCRFGDLWPWSVGIHGPHTSQHLVNPYSLTHVLHGLLFYAFFRLVGARLGWDVRLVLAVALECLWELAENSGAVIGRYRQATIALGYEGDSVLNSLGDIASCAIGYLLAGWLPVRWSVVLFLLVEGTLLVAYRDNLLLNVIMLVHPIEALKSWQAGP